MQTWKHAKCCQKRGLSLGHIYVQTNAHFLVYFKTYPGGGGGGAIIQVHFAWSCTYQLKNWLIKKAAKVARKTCIINKHH